MHRIPIGELKLFMGLIDAAHAAGLNAQNSDWGIETCILGRESSAWTGLNAQNSDWGIETVTLRPCSLGARA